MPALSATKGSPIAPLGAIQACPEQRHPFAMLRAGTRAKRRVSEGVSPLHMERMYVNVRVCCTVLRLQTSLDGACSLLYRELAEYAGGGVGVAFHMIVAIFVP